MRGQKGPIANQTLRIDDSGVALLGVLSGGEAGTIRHKGVHELLTRSIILEH